MDLYSEMKGARHKICTAVYSIPCRNEGCMVDALASKSDEGRGMAAISLGKMPSNRYNRGSPNGETLLSTIETTRKSGAYPGK